MNLVTRLLTQYFSPQDLYQALVYHHEFSLKEKIKYYFQQRTRHQLVERAFDINDHDKTITLKDSDQLRFLVKYLSPINKRHAAIYLALLINQLTFPHLKNNTAADDVPHSNYHEVMRLLRNLKLTNPSRKLLVLINEKFLFYQHITSATVAFPSTARVLTEMRHGNAVHLSRDILLDNKIYVEKYNVRPRIADMEVFCGTMMELFLGPHQPTTRQLRGDLDKPVSVLSEKLDLHFLDQSVAFRKWASLGFIDAGFVDVASLYMAENDYHRGNAGLQRINNVNRLTRIDFDQMLYPIVLQMIGDRAALGEKSVNLTLMLNDEVEIEGAYRKDCFGLHADDFNCLPSLPNPLAISDPGQHYIPHNWWLNREKTIAIRPTPRYLAERNTAILEKIILPSVVIKMIVEATIFNLNDRRIVIDYFQYRQQQLQAIASRIDGFVDFVWAESVEIVQIIKNRYLDFVIKRSDLFRDDRVDDINQQVLHAYDANVKQYLHELRLSTENESVSSSLCVSPPSSCSEMVSSDSSLSSAASSNTNISTTCLAGDCHFTSSIPLADNATIRLG